MKWVDAQVDLPNERAGLVLVSDGEEIWEDFAQFVEHGVETGEITYWMPYSEIPLPNQEEVK